MSRPGKPFRFLDYYNIEDADLFFGREKEVRILLADILVNRLVVLFARTGTGKTSLVNAGVRPKLEAQGYTTFFVRVHKDPITSALEEIALHSELKSPVGAEFAEQLENVADQLNRPIVLFFDQFEEFFIYIYNHNRTEGQAFIANIAHLYYNDKSRVHVVFSMREEFFVEMDAFREKIPTIFHNECNLRLRGFDKAQARDAIVYPLRAFGSWIEADLVARIVDDLCQTSDTSAAGMEVEPAQLQIVCDTLWDKRVGTTITLSDYLALGQRGHGNIAQEVLLSRLLAGFEEITSAEELDLLQRLLPLLRTAQGTKYVRQVRTLAELLKSGEPTVRDLLQKLSHAHFIRIIQRAGLEVVELAHDYLVAHLDELRACARMVVPRRILRAAFSRFQLTGLPAGIDELQAIAAVLGEITIDRDAAEFLFRSALAAGQLVPAFFNLALAREVPVLKMIRQQVFGFGVKEAARAFNVLSDVLLADQSAMLPEAQSEIFQLATEALEDADLTLIAQTFLAKAATSQAGLSHEQARRHLLKFLNRSSQGLSIASETLVALGSLESMDSLGIIERGLPRDSAQDALVRLTTAEDSDIAGKAKRLAIRFVEEALEQNQLPFSALRALGEIESLKSVTLAQKALFRPGLKTTATLILRDRLCNSAIPEVAAAARIALAANPGAGPPDIITEKSIEPEMVAAPDEPLAASDLAYLENLVEAVSKSQCILFVGAGVHYSPAARFQSGAESADQPPVGSVLARILAEESGYLSQFPNEDFGNLPRVAAWYELKFSRLRLVDRVSSIFAKTSPSPILHALAALPFSLIITSCFDQLFEQALVAAGKKPMLSIYHPDPKSPTEDPVDDPTPQAPFICKLYGDIELPDSVVITEDDFIQHTFRMSDRAPFHPIPETFLYRLKRWESLCLGWSFQSYNLRFLWSALNRGVPPELRMPTYVIDPRSDSLFRAKLQSRRDLVFIKQDTGKFVQNFLERIKATGLAPESRS